MNQEEMNKEENAETKSVVFDGVFFLAILLKHKFFVLGFTLIGAIASIIITIMIPNEYTAVVNAVPPKADGGLLGGALGGVSSALKEFGLTKMGGGSKGGDQYSLLVILNSRTVKDSLMAKYDFATRYEIPDSLPTNIRKEIEGNMVLTFNKEGNYEIGFTDVNPDTAAMIANDIVYYANQLSRHVSHKNAMINRGFIEKRIAAIDSTLAVISDSLQKYSSKTFMFSPMDQASSMSKSYSELKAEIIRQELMFDMLKTKYGDKDMNTLTQGKMLESLRRKVHEIEVTPGFVGNFPLKDATKVGIEFLRMYAELEVFTKVKGLLMPMLEEAKLDEVKQSEILITVDPAIAPDKKSWPKRSFIVAGSTFGSFVIVVLALVLLYGIKNIRKNYSDLMQKIK
jgi:hypothetical protein